METKNRLSGSTDNEPRQRSDCPDDEAGDHGALDGGYGWMVVAYCFVIQFSVVGVLYSAGLWVAEFQEQFDLSTKDAALIASLGTSFLGFAAPFGGILSNYLGHRPIIFAGCLASGLGLVIAAYSTTIPILVLSYGILSGAGYGLSYSPSVAVVSIYFKRKQTIALAVAVIGAAIGPLVCPLVIRWFISHYTWRGAMVAMGCMLIQCCALAALLIPVRLCRRRHYVNQSIRVTNDVQRNTRLSCGEIMDYRLLLDKTFVVHFVSVVLWYSSFSTVWILLPNYAIHSRMSKDQGAFLVSSLGLGNTAGTLFSALLMTCLPSRFRVYFHSLSLFAVGGMLLLYPLYESFAFFLTVSLFVGCTFGFVLSTLPIVTADLHGQDRLTSAYSYLMLACGLGCLLGPAFAGWLFELSSEYTLPFCVNGVLYITAGILLISLPFIKRCHK